MTGLLWGTVIWAIAAASWLVLLPKDQKGKNWSRIHALAPFLAIVVYALAPAGALRDGLGAWLSMAIPIAIILAATWLVGTLIKNHSIMDFVYPVVPLLAGGYTMLQHRAQLTGWSVLLLALMAVWAIRLAIQIFGRNSGKEQEPYATWRARLGRRWLWWSIYQVYLLQGTMLWFWCASLAFAFSAPAPQSWLLALLGTLFWLVGFVFQAGADMQVERFKREPANRGKLVQTGLWSLSRHPNYFGEAMIWWGYFAFALAHPFGIVAIISPVYVTWFMGYGSATPFKERHMRRTRPDYPSYAARVPMFWPWPLSRGSRPVG
jgi:steroid 5-alpha reductase family enzyme